MSTDEQELNVAYRHIRACQAARDALYQQLGDGQLFDVVARAYDTRIARLRFDIEHSLYRMGKAMKPDKNENRPPDVIVEGINLSELQRNVAVIMSTMRYLGHLAEGIMEAAADPETRGYRCSPVGRNDQAD
jgi:hypothetical protein